MNCNPESESRTDYIYKVSSCTDICARLHGRAQMERRERRAMERGRDWIITVQAPRNTPRGWKLTFPRSWEGRYGYKAQVYELGKEASSEHTHILIYFRNPRSSNVLAKEIMRCNSGCEVDVERRRGSWEAARNYIMKQDETAIPGRVPIEWGEIPRDYGSGKKTEKINEAKEIAEMISGGGMRKIAEERPDIVLKHPQGCKTLKEVLGNPSEKRTVAVTIVWGDAGVGKSTWVQQEAEKRWEKEEIYHFSKVGGSRDTVWFSGYTGQKCLILDDISGRAMPYEYIIKITGNDPMDVEFKGGREAAKWEEVWITSNWNPMGWYQKIWEECPETREAFFRRIHRIIHVFKENDDGHVIWDVEKEEEVHQMRKDFRIEPCWAKTPRWVREERRCGEERTGMRDNDCNVRSWNGYEDEDENEETNRSGEGLAEEIIGCAPGQNDTPGNGLYWGGGDEVKMRRGCKNDSEYERELLKSQIFHLFCDEFNKRRTILGASEMCREEIATGVREGVIKYNEKEWLDRERWRSLTGNNNIGKFIAEKEAELYTWMEEEFGVVELE